MRRGLLIDLGGGHVRWLLVRGVVRGSSIGSRRGVSDSIQVVQKREVDVSQAYNTTQHSMTRHDATQYNATQAKQLLYSCTK